MNPVNRPARGGWPGSARHGAAVWMAAVVAALALAGAGPQAGWSSDVHDAAQSGDEKTLEEILKNDPDAVKERDENGWTPLHLAAQFGHLEAVKALVAAHADVNATTPKGWTPLLLAARAGKSKILVFLLQNKADPNAVSQDGNTALYWALKSGDSEAALALVNAGANLHRYASDGTTPLYMAIAPDKPDPELVAALLSKGAEINAGSTFVAFNPRSEPVGQLATPLNEAVAKGDLDMVKLLVDHGADVNAVDLDAHAGNCGPVPLLGETPLGMAVALDQKDIASYLIDHDANIEAPDFLGLHPLHVAVLADKKDMVDLLLAHHADPNAPGLMNETPYSLACGGQTGPLHVEENAELEAELKKAGGKIDEALHAEAMQKRYYIAAFENLRAICTAEEQYCKQTDSFADSGKLLGDKSLIGPDLAPAFEQYLGNADSAKPTAHAGYIYRLLPGDATDKEGYRKKGDPHALETFAVIARPVSGKGMQLFISEAGTVYQKKDPGTGKFLLDSALDEKGLAKDGWAPAGRNQEDD
ncbi:MAG: ankyrin repeat domain-containing protein [Planctomycetota bacterium]